MCRAFDQCVAPAASALLCDSTDQECICSGYRINRGSVLISTLNPSNPIPNHLSLTHPPKLRCYTLYCPSQTWKFEDRGTQCGSIPTLSAQLLTASPPAHPTPIASDGSQPPPAAAASAGAGAAATATASAAKSSHHPSSSGSGGATLGMGASSAGAVVNHGGGICWVVVVGLWFWLWSRVLM